MAFGSMKAVVKFANQSIVEGNANYGLEGAMFEVLLNGKHVGIMKSDEEGIAKMANLAPGVYEVHQIAPCRGGVCNPKVGYTAVVLPGDEVVINFAA